MSHAIHHSYSIGGMNSDICVAAVKNKLFDVFGVSSVKVDLENKQAEIVSFEEIRTDTFQKALSNSDFTIAEIND